MPTYVDHDQVGGIVHHHIGIGHHNLIRGGTLSAASVVTAARPLQGVLRKTSEASSIKRWWIEGTFHVEPLV